MSNFGYKPDGRRVESPYLVTIHNTGPDGETKVEAVMQEKVRFGVENRWQEWTSAIGQAAPQAAMVNFGGVLENAVLNMAGYSAQNQIFSRKTWVGASTTPIALRLKFQASTEAGTRDEVGEACKALHKIASPIYGVLGQLIPPGPTMNPFLQSSTTNIHIGRLATFPNVVITSLHWSADVKFNNMGYPVAAECDITFETYEVLTNEDVKRSFFYEPL